MCIFHQGSGFKCDPIEKPDIREQIYPCQNVNYFLAKAEETIYDYAPIENTQSETKILRYIAQVIIFSVLSQSTASITESNTRQNE